MPGRPPGKPPISPIDYRPSDSVCKWSVKASECPAKGCLGFQVEFPKGFSPDGKDYRPTPTPFNSGWNVGWVRASQDIAGKGDCFYRNPPANYDPFKKNDPCN